MTRIRRGLWWAAGLGLGIGLMVTGTVIAAWPQRPLTDQEVVARARKLGMVNLTQLPAGGLSSPAP